MNTPTSNSIARRIAVAGLLALLLSLNFLSKAQTSGDDFLERWDHSETYLLKFVRLMPDSLYDYRPTKDMFSFDEQLHHINEHLSWIHHTYLIGNVNAYKEQSYQKMAAEDRIAMLRTTFQDIREAVLVLDETDLNIRYDFKPAGTALRTIDLLYLLLDHTTHHRGQLVVYLRLNGIEPPAYVGW